MKLLYTTWPDEESAQRAAGRLLEDRLIACANILGASTSIYAWQGEVKREREIVALFKTSAKTASAARDRLIELHPYDEPCIIALEVDRAPSAKGFLDWVEAETGPRA